MRIIVVAPDKLGDDSEEYAIVEDNLERITLKMDPKTLRIVTPGAGGVGSNRLIHRWCNESFTGYEIWWPYKNKKRQKAQMDKMFEGADAFVAFWDGLDGRTFRRIKKARRFKIKRIKVVIY